MIEHITSFCLIIDFIITLNQNNSAATFAHTENWTALFSAQ